MTIAMGRGGKREACFLAVCADAALGAIHILTLRRDSLFGMQLPSTDSERTPIQSTRKVLRTLSGRSGCGDGESFRFLACRKGDDLSKGRRV